MVAVSLALFTFAGCSSSDSDPLEGRFVDSPVSGISYRCLSSSGNVTYSGTTDADGVFLYYAGNTVEFSIGGIVIPILH